MKFPLFFLTLSQGKHVRAGALAFLSSCLSLQAAEMKLWYEAPAKSMMNEALPIGNSSLGGLISGGVEKERVVLNEKTLWRGTENSGGKYDIKDFGAFQMLGDLFIEQPGHEGGRYRRELDISTADAKVTYQSKGISYTREYFASHPDGVLVVKLTADRPGSHTGIISLVDSHEGTAGAEGNRLHVTGKLDNGLIYDYQLIAKNEGGKLTAQNGKLQFENCNSLVLTIAAGTNYSPDYATGYRGAAPGPAVTQRVDQAAAKGYDALWAAHQADYLPLYKRVSLDLGESTAAQKEMPTDKRKIAAVTSTDPELEQLLFQLGRYLTIASSRAGTLPSNLQGVWNDSNKPTWFSDYHVNINTQMNYWLVESTNLAECHLSLFDYIQSQLEPWRKATSLAANFKTQAGEMTSRGFAVRTSLNPFGGMGWNWDNTANAWLCQHFWEHYSFSGDKTFLKEKAYPIMKETSQFWIDHLKALPDGRLVIPNGWSPEHGPHEDGVSYNQQIVWDLFNNTVEAGTALNTDKEFLAELTKKRDLLVGPKIGKWGQLQEWMDDKDSQNDHHRHTSHLFAVYPGRQVSVAKTPELAKAAKISLDARGIADDSDVREWALAWRTLLYARLHDGESCHQMIRTLFSARNTCPNLFGLHPPMQIDGNFGISAGIAEMLVQSHENEINLLPALPQDWPKGRVTNLRARGGFEVSIDWQNGGLNYLSIKSTGGIATKVRYKNQLVPLQLKPGQTVVLNSKLQPR